MPSDLLRNPIAVAFAALLLGGGVGAGAVAGTRAPACQSCDGLGDRIDALDGRLRPVEVARGETATKLQAISDSLSQIKDLVKEITVTKARK